MRDPAVHWDGKKAVFSMVIGAPDRQYEVIQTRWQLYEITGLGPEDPQPFNLKIAGSDTFSRSTDDALYEVAYLQFFQGSLVRGIGLMDPDDSSRDGRRVLARPITAPEAFPESMAPADAPEGSVALGSDGSMAALVPARRAMTWQLTDPGGAPVVRERYWLTFQPGEIRTCSSCHGINHTDQLGRQPPANPPANPPEALRDLLRRYKEQTTSEVPTIPVPAIQSIRRPANGGAWTVRILGEPNQGGHIERSRDLKVWMEATAFVTDQAGLFDWQPEIEPGTDAIIVRVRTPQ